MTELIRKSECNSIEAISHISQNFKKLLTQNQERTTKGALHFFQKIAFLTMEYVRAVEQYRNETRLTKLQHCNVLEHLMTLYSTCELFSSKFLNFNHLLQEECLIELKRCICKRLSIILENFNNVIVANDNQKTDIGLFVKLMNVALDKLSHIDITKGCVTAQLNLDEARNIIEEILCFSMAISQVAVDDYPKIITAGCQSVLNGIATIKVEILKEEPNRAMCNLVVEHCNDALCALEAQVNMAVLRLCLQVFSNYQQPLDNLVSNTCDVLLANFDLNMDRIFQIALFSVANSSIGKGVATIKAVTSNLGFLEAELIPIIMVKSIKGREEKEFVGLLQKFWCKQVKCLRKAIHAIIEPSAYCKLIYEELLLRTDEFWSNIANAKAVQISQLDPFIKYGDEVSTMITTCFEYFKQDEQENIRKNLNIINYVLKELKSCKASLEQQEGTDVPKSNHSLFKRSQLLVKAIEQLWLSITDEDDQDIPPKDKEESKYNIGDVVDEPQLTSIINKSRKLVKDRSMYGRNLLSKEEFTPVISTSFDPKVMEANNYSRTSIYNCNSDENFELTNTVYSAIKPTVYGVEVIPNANELKD